MYAAFDNFLQTDTWHTTHPMDEKRFIKALAAIVKDRDFNPDEMGNYMRRLTKSPTNVEDQDHPYEDAIQRLVTKAWAVKEYLALTGDT